MEVDALIKRVSGEYLNFKTFFFPESDYAAVMRASASEARGGYQEKYQVAVCTSADGENRLRPRGNPWSRSGKSTSGLRPVGAGPPPPTLKMLFFSRLNDLKIIFWTENVSIPQEADWKGPRRTSSRDSFSPTAQQSIPKCSNCIRTSRSGSDR